MNEQSSAIVVKDKHGEETRSGIPPILNRAAWFTPVLEDIDLGAEITAYAGIDRRS